MKVLIIAATGVQPSGNGTTIRDKREDRVVVATPLAGLTSPQKSASESASLMPPIEKRRRFIGSVGSRRVDNRDPNRFLVTRKRPPLRHWNCFMASQPGEKVGGQVGHSHLRLGKMQCSAGRPRMVENVDRRYLVRIELVQLKWRLIICTSPPIHRRPLSTGRFCADPVL
jgi:hypothetical protein